MTSVFVSYSRADRAKIEPLVALIGATGAEVWWDDRLVSGETFSEEIERRLNAADFVVVAWSPASVKSKWVLDEAAAGRDAGKLLPVSLDGQMAPIGFRQVHTTDFSGWTGGAEEKCARALKAALTRDLSSRTPRSGDPGPRAALTTALGPHGVPALASLGRDDRRWIAFAIGGVLAVALAVVAAFQMAPGRLGGPPQGSIAVLPFADISAGKDRAYFAEGIAEEILSALARYPALKVIGRTSASKFSGPSVDFAEVRRALNVEHVLEGSVRAAPGRIKITVALLRTSDGVRIWSEEYDRPEAEIFTIEDEVGEEVARRVGGVEGGTDLPAATADISSLDLLLAARQKLRKRTWESSDEARRLLEQAMQLDPASAAIHGALAEALVLSDFTQSNSLPQARALAEKAIALAPDRADGYAALALIVGQGEARRQILEKAIALDPSRSDLKMWLAGLIKDEEAYFAAMREVIAFDPLWHRPVQNLASRLVALGRFEEAERAIADYEARAPDDRVNPALWRMEFADWRGDFASSYASLLKVDPQTDDTKYERARTLAVLGFDEKARALVPESKIPPDAWRRRDPDAIFRLTYAIPQFTTALPYELLADHRRDADILKLYDERLVSTDAFCGKIAEFGVARGAPSLVWALMLAGRNVEAGKISACAGAFLKTHAEADEGMPGIAEFPKAPALFYLAQIDALAGREADAIANLRAAFEENFGALYYSFDLREYRAFDALRLRSDAFHVIEGKIDAEAARQRAAIVKFDEEAARASRKAG